MEHDEDDRSTTVHSITGAGESKTTVRSEKRGKRMGAITFPISSMKMLEGVTGLADFERLVVQNIKVWKEKSRSDVSERDQLNQIIT